MTKLRVLSLLVAVAVLAASVAAVVVYAQPSKAVEPLAVNFGGKAVVLELKSGSVVHLHGPQVRRMGGHQYVVGKVEIFDGSKPDLFGGSTTWILLDEVVRMGVFEDINHLADVYRAVARTKK
jgi:hypothetical protein